jgi:hypothetical protein
VIVHLIDTQERNVNILNNLKQNKITWQKQYKHK